MSDIRPELLESVTSHPACEAQQRPQTVSLAVNASRTVDNPPYRRLREHCEQSGQSPRAALQDIAAGTLKITHTGSLVARFNDLNQRLTALMTLDIPTLIDTLFPDVRYYHEDRTHLGLAKDRPAGRPLYRDSAACTIVMRWQRRLKSYFSDHRTFSVLSRPRQGTRDS